MSAKKLPCLSANDLQALNIGEPWQFGISDVVRFAELDILNHVNNGAYIGWLENARVSYFMNYGISDYASADQPVLVLRNLQVDFRAPLHLSDRYVVTARSVQYGRSSWQMEHAIFCDGELKATASCAIVTVNPEGTASVPLTDSIVKTISERDGAKPKA